MPPQGAVKRPLTFITSQEDIEANWNGEDVAGEDAALAARERRQVAEELRELILND